MINGAQVPTHDGNADVESFGVEADFDFIFAIYATWYILYKLALLYP